MNEPDNYPPQAPTPVPADPWWPRVVVIVLSILVALLAAIGSYLFGYWVLIIILPLALVLILLAGFWRRLLPLTVVGYTAFALLVLVGISLVGNWARESEPEPTAPKGYYWPAVSTNGLIARANFNVQAYLSRLVPPPNGSYVYLNATNADLKTRNLLDGQRLNYVCAYNQLKVKAVRSFRWPRAKASVLISLPVNGWQLKEDPVSSLGAPNGVWCAVYNNNLLVARSVFAEQRPRFGTSNLPPAVKDRRPASNREPIEAVKGGSNDKESQFIPQRFESSTKP